MQAAGDCTSKGPGLTGCSCFALGPESREQGTAPIRRVKCSATPRLCWEQSPARPVTQLCLGAAALLAGTAQNPAREGANHRSASAVIPRQRSGLAPLLSRLLRQTKPGGPGAYERPVLSSGNLHIQTLHLSPPPPTS